MKRQPSSSQGRKQQGMSKSSDMSRSRQQEQQMPRSPSPSQRPPSDIERDAGMQQGRNLDHRDRTRDPDQENLE